MLRLAAIARLATANDRGQEGERTFVATSASRPAFQQPPTLHKRPPCRRRRASSRRPGSSARPLYSETPHAPAAAKMRHSATPELNPPNPSVEMRPAVSEK